MPGGISIKTVLGCGTRLSPTPLARVIEPVIILVGTAIAFWIGYTYASCQPFDLNWPHRLLGPALNYACAGHLGLIAPSEEATAADLEAMERVAEFLRIERLDLPCSLFPGHLEQTSLLNGLDIANVEQPFHVILVYAAIWRLFDPSWSATYFIIAVIVTTSFLVTYFCLRRFASAIAAAAVALLFLSSPFFLTNISSPRDAAKFPFAVAIGALLVGVAARPRSPFRYCLFAGIVGLLIGIGYGFRSDLMFFLIPASIILVFLGRAKADTSKITSIKFWWTNFCIRFSALGALILAFCLGGIMPLINDYILHEDYADIGYHPLAMGLLGQTRRDLYQSHGFDGIYMYRNDYNTDLAVGFRIMEQAARRYGDEVDFAKGHYWRYGKRYYLDVIRNIPADIISGAIGGFVNLMTVPRNFFDRHTLATFDHTRPWVAAYSCAPNSTSCLIFSLAMDKMFLLTSRLSPELLFVANAIVLVVFLCLIVNRYGLQSAVATLVLLGVIVAVTSLRFEMRHMFYLYVFSLLAWVAVSAWVVRLLANYSTGGALAGTELTAPPSALAVHAPNICGLFLVSAAIVYVALWSARLYQVRTLRAVIEDLTSRTTINAQYEIVERAPGLSIIRILSAAPLSTGGTRTASEAPKPHVEMSLLRIVLDGDRCPDRLVTVKSVSDSSAYSHDPAFFIHETFVAEFNDREEYVVFLPAFNYLLQIRSITADTQFAGIEIQNADVPCVKAVRLVSEFKKKDTLFDFVTPQEPRKIGAEELYQKVYLPGFGFI